MSKRYATLRQRNPFNVGPGDVVEITRPYRGGVVTGVVTQVTPRYGRIATDLVQIQDATSGETTSYGSSLVTRVISRSSRPAAPVNIFQTDHHQITDPNDFRASIHRQGGLMAGRLMDLIKFELGAMTGRTLDRPLEADRAEEMVRRARPGVIRLSHPDADFLGATVRRKPFQVWVRRHAEQLMCTVVELHQQEEAYQEPIRRQYRADFRAETEGWFTDPFQERDLSDPNRSSSFQNRAMGHEVEFELGWGSR
jgi:hypothetical protein